MKYFKKLRALLLVVVVLFYSLPAFSKVITKQNVIVEYVELEDGGVKVISVKNVNSKKVNIIIDDSSPLTITGNSSIRPERIARTKVYYEGSFGSGHLWKRTEEEKINEKPAPVKLSTEQQPATAIKDDKPVKSEVTDKKDTKTQKIVEPMTSIQPAPTIVVVNDLPASTDIDYVERLNQDPYFGTDAVNTFTKKIDDLCNGLESSKNKDQYIIDNDIEDFLAQSYKEINEKRGNIAFIAKEIVGDSNFDEEKQKNVLNSIVEALSWRLKTREDAYNKLETLIKSVKPDTANAEGKDETIYVIIAVIVVLVALLTVVFMRKRNKKQPEKKNFVTQAGGASDTTHDNQGIIVRRRTTSMLKKQSLDDVLNNPAYLQINASDFTPDSAVNKIYLKNSCIKEVYNLYAEDLRNTENPKEDGCMVLGRWVYDEASQMYDVSLEEVVFPGDDAVFKEYELNFGGKIKLRIAERLRKLRRETNLQYDLVCWIHSHPGLGVFFSNSDDNVQMQLKHAQHPNFLTAFVVDILTSDQEMGIFTFRKDGTMNSKGDLTKMYSLEEMYKWALESERSSFSPDKYFNILENAKLKKPSCKGVELNNDSIIDLTQIAIEPETGVVGWAVGTTVERKNEREYVVSGIVHGAERPGAGVIGCVISMTHMSFPTIQRLIAYDSVNLAFVMVYSSKQQSLTTIPVINGEILADEQYYGDVNIEALKIWTRRKR